MKIIFHEDYYNSNYASDPAAAPGRLDFIMGVIHERPTEYTIIQPEPATAEDILRAHSQKQFESIKHHPLLYQLASLAAGGAILAAASAMSFCVWLVFKFLLNDFLD